MSTTNAQMHLGAPINNRPSIASVEMGAPLGWIRDGFNDFRKTPVLSLLYGTLFAGMCAGVYLANRNAPWFILAYLTGLVVIGPFIGSGLYAASREMERGTRPKISSSVSLILRRRTYLALFSLMLALVMSAWIRFSALLFAVTTNTLSPSTDAYLNIFTSSDGWVAMTFFAGIGLLLVTVVFVASAVAIPLILDRDTDFVAAVGTSYQAVKQNPVAMFVWVGAIVTLTAVGIGTAFIGFPDTTDKLF